MSTQTPTEKREGVEWGFRIRMNPFWAQSESDSCAHSAQSWTACLRKFLRHTRVPAARVARESQGPPSGDQSLPLSPQMSREARGCPVRLSGGQMGCGKRYRDPLGYLLLNAYLDAPPTVPREACFVDLFFRVPGPLQKTRGYVQAASAASCQCPGVSGHPATRVQSRTAPHPDSAIPLPGVAG